MKTRSTLFAALLLCAALIVPTSADQGKPKQEQSQPTEAEQKKEQDDWKEWWEFHQGQLDSGAFDAMDKDENQGISREEWAGSRGLFDRLDRDHDGSISLQEYEDREFRGMTREALFGRMDANGNGRLEPAEWWWSRDAFTLVDGDGNGWITPQELLHRGEPQPR